jgi:hypothetical protein
VVSGRLQCATVRSLCLHPDLNILVPHTCSTIARRLQLYILRSVFGARPGRVLMRGM